MTACMYHTLPRRGRISPWKNRRLAYTGTYSYLSPMSNWSWNKPRARMAFSITQWFNLNAKQQYQKNRELSKAKPPQTEGLAITERRSWQTLPVLHSSKMNKTPDLIGSGRTLPKSSFCQKERHVSMKKSGLVANTQNAIRHLERNTNQIKQLVTNCQLYQSFGKALMGAVNTLLDNDLF